MLIVSCVEFIPLDMLLPHINYGMPILHFGGARRSGGCRYCHTALWKRAMRRLAHGLMRSRGVTRSLARDVTWHCVRLHPIRLNRAFRVDYQCNGNTALQTAILRQRWVWLNSVWLLLHLYGFKTHSHYIRNVFCFVYWYVKVLGQVDAI